MLAAAQVIGIALVVGLMFVLLTAYLTEQYTQRGVSQRVQELITTVESTTQIACFTKDQSLALEVANGLMRNGEVYGVIIVSGVEFLVEQYKDDVDSERQRLAFDRRLAKPIVSPFDPKTAIGEIIVHPDPEFVRERVKENGGFVALLLGMQLLIIVVAVVAAVLLWVVRPIKNMSDKLHVMDAHSIEPLPIPSGQESTEIGRLASDINQLGQRLVASRDEERHLHLQCEIGERKYRAIFENADSGIFVVDSSMMLESCNHAFYRLLDLVKRNEEIDLLKLRWQNPDAFAELFERCIAFNRLVSDDFEYMVGGEIRWFNVTLTQVGNQLIQGQLTDISRHKLAELSAQQETITDSLTGLLNRRGFMQKLDEEIDACSKGSNPGFALLIVDIDGFRRVNESMGLVSGDQILSITANRLRSCLDSLDIISRLGNDTFCVILRTTSNKKLVANIGRRISLILKGFYEVDDTSLQLGASMGIALFPSDGDDQETLLCNAEMALENARASGSGQYRFFDFTMAENAEYRSRLENDLRLAVRRKELIIQYQPIIDLSLRKMIGAEALIRWMHPVQGMISPDAFVPLAEDIGVISNIGLWMIDAVCQQLALWKEQGADYYVSVNISPRQIPDGLPPITLIETVNRYGLDPTNLSIEITESVFMGDSEAAKIWLDAVHELGFRICLDDFGTGFSSLSYIKRFPVDVLKVDKSFVRDMSEDNSDRTLVSAIINMANSLGLTVVAEGVESQHQLILLEEDRCRCAQGYFLSPPVLEGEIRTAELHINDFLTSALPDEQSSTHQNNVT